MRDRIDLTPLAKALVAVAVILGAVILVVTGHGEWVLWMLIILCIWGIP